MNADQDKTRARIDLLAMAVGLLRRYVMGPGLLESFDHERAERFPMLKRKLDSYNFVRQCEFSNLSVLSQTINIVS